MLLLLVLCPALCFAAAHHNATWDLVGLEGLAGRLLPSTVSSECHRDLMHMMEATVNFESWALRMVDASAKLQSGVLDGNIKNLGQFDECISADTPPRFSGQYCLANVQLDAMPGHPRREVLERLLNQATLGRRDREININRNEIMPLPDVMPSLSLVQLGVCVPSSCSAHDVQLTLSAALQWLARPAGLVASAQLLPGSCSVLREQPWTAAEFAFIIILVCIMALVAAGTTCDLLWPDTNNQTPLRRVLFAFSFPANWGRLFSFGPPPPGSLASLDGIRGLSTLWVILGHKVMIYLQQPWVNKVKIVQTLSSIALMPAWNNMLSVDTFFMMSGLLKASSVLRELDRGRFHFGSIMWRRYLRLTPAYALMIAFYATLLTRLNNGPAWQKFVEQPGSACRSQWPLNLLYVNNYISNDNLCMIQTWYLAADMQLHILAPLLLFPLWRWPRHAMNILSASALLSVAVPFAITVLTGALPTFLVGAPDASLAQYVTGVHFTTHMRAAAFVVGVALGYFMHRTNLAAVRMSKTTVAAGWALCMALLYAAMFGVFGLIQFDNAYEPLEMALYGALHRPVWAIAVAWIVFACHTGYGGWINKLLCAQVFQALSRLSYCIFLTHYVVLTVGSGRLRTALHITEYDLLHGMAGDTFVSLLTASCLHLFVEAPLLELTRMYYSTAKPAAKMAAPSPVKSSLTNGTKKMVEDVEEETLKGHVTPLITDSQLLVKDKQR